MTPTGQNKMMVWALGVMASVIIGLISVMYGTNEKNFADAKYERRQAKAERMEIRRDLQEFVRNSISTAGNVTSLINRVEKNEQAIEKLRDR